MLMFELTMGNGIFRQKKATGVSRRLTLCCLHHVNAVGSNQALIRLAKRAKMVLIFVDQEVSSGISSVLVATQDGDPPTREGSPNVRPLALVEPPHLLLPK